MRMSVENGIVAFIVVVVELVIEGLEDEDRFAEDEDDYDIAAFTNNSIFSASRTLKLARGADISRACRVISHLFVATPVDRARAP